MRGGQNLPVQLGGVRNNEETKFSGTELGIIPSMNRAFPSVPLERLQGTRLNRDWVLFFGLYREMVTLPWISGAVGAT
jgi:hypothetical protein